MGSWSGSRPRVGLLGSGLLHLAVSEALDERAEPYDIDAPTEHRSGLGPPLLVAVSDCWQADHSMVRTAAARSGAPWVPVRTELERGVIGPLEMPGLAGCADCADLRRWRVRADGHDAVWQRHRNSLTRLASSWLTGLGAQLIGAIVAEEAEALSGGAQARTHQALVQVDLGSLSVTRHGFLPDPWCPRCGDLPDDSPERARIVLSHRPAHSPGGFRTRALRAELPTLLDTYVDSEAGLVRSVTGWSDGGLVMTAATVALRTHGAGAEAGYGRTSSFEASKVTALLEALERYASEPAGGRTVVRASYREISERALDPRTLGLYPAERYEVPGFRYRPFSDDEPYLWVWGWSFQRQEPILVPESYAYYGAHRHGDDGPPFVYEVSNGCALGSCLEEAILYGILEVAERDAFLLTWYARLPAPRIDIADARDRTVPLLAASIGAETGYEIRLFDTTTEQGIPCVWAMAVNPQDDGRPAVACAAGSHPDPEQAIRNALHELGPCTSMLTRHYADDPGRAAQMAADPSLVMAMEDHSLLYADPVAASRLDFLNEGGSVRPVGDVGADPGGFASDDLRDNVWEAVGRNLDTGLDVIVVDQTAAEHRAGGFACVKVIIPGTLPMTFGHQRRRVHGLPRLYEVPRLLGYLDRPLRGDEVNPHPHPFP